MSSKPSTSRTRKRRLSHRTRDWSETRKDYTGNEWHKLEPSKNPNYKCVLCKNWEEFGSCKYGDRCVFAHGENELNVSKRNISQKQLNKESNKEPNEEPNEEPEKILMIDSHPVSQDNHSLFMIPIEQVINRENLFVINDFNTNRVKKYWTHPLRRRI